MALGRTRRFLSTTAVRLSLLYFVVFVVVTGALMAYIGRTTADVLTRDLRDGVNAEIADLQEIYEAQGLRATLVSIEQRSRVPGAGLYLAVDVSGNVITGNVTQVPPIVFGGATEDVRPIPYDRDGATARRPFRPPHQALVRVMQLDEGVRVLIGRDLGEHGRMREVFNRAVRALVLAMLVLGLVTWWFVSRRVLKRIDQVSRTGQQIVGGDLTGRLAVTGSGDEFDRLAVGVNTMLQRIEALMKGLKEVSDNIAHDLKTPLTRMRNRLDDALAGPEDAARYKAALEATVEESDSLIRTFDALLMIARVESGNQPVPLEPLDLATVVRDVAELYEPAAEDQGATLVVEAGEAVPVEANRELLSQALSNLIDNALKYGRAEGRPQVITVRAAKEAGRAVLSVADNGPGVPDEDRDRALARFVRLEASRSTPGSGLGLALATAIARAHGATLTLKDNGPGLRVEIGMGAD